VRQLGDLLPSPDDELIALTPQAYEECFTRGLVPTVLDDHAARPGFCFEPHPYLRWQLDWLRRLDHLADLRGVGTACALLLTAPMDAIVVMGRLLATTIDALDPVPIHLMGVLPSEEVDPYHEGNLQFWPEHGDLPLAARLLPLIAEARSRPYSITEIATQPLANTGAPLAASYRIRRKVAAVLGPYLWSRPLHDMRTGKPATLFTWTSSYGVRWWAKHERKQGHRVVFLERDRRWTRIIDPSHLRGRGRRHSMTRPVVGQLSAEALKILDEIDEWSGVPGSGRVLASRLLAYLTSLCPAVQHAATALEHQLRTFGVTRVMSANPSSLEEFGVLTAAKKCHVQRVMAQHGDHLFSCASWLISETHNFEELLISDATIEYDLNHAARALNTIAPPMRIQSQRTAAIRRRSRVIRNSGRRVVAYVPSMLRGDSYQLEAFIEDAWYHRWHRRLLDFMEERDDVEFIWKALPQADLENDPIATIIQDRRIANVSYETRPFLRVADRTDRMFTDFPSTCLYEAVHLGLPVLALWFPAFGRLRSSAVNRFERVVRLCGTEQEAQTCLSAFLAEEASAWVVPELRDDDPA
jgi:hypothetical protein